MQPVMAETKTETKEPRWKLALRAFVRLSLILVTLLAAGGLHWLRGWIFAALFLASYVTALAVIRRKNPALIRVRLKKLQPTKPFDKVFVALYITAFLAFLVVAGLDGGRFGWSALRFRWIWPGMVLHLAGALPVTWAAATNPYLETTVRIQNDRGHTTITGGPYRLVRHPMYTGILVSFSGWPLILGSLWSYIPVVVVVALFVFRTAREDQTLRTELSGYSDYCRRTRYRLLPGIW